MRMSGAFLELGHLSFFGKGQIPQLNTVISLVTDGKSFMFQELRVRQERFLLSG